MLKQLAGEEEEKIKPLLLLPFFSYHSKKMSSIPYLAVN
jgi:hypothetical protein